MKREEYKSEKFIFPENDWRCFVCRKESVNLELFAETEKEVTLICETCAVRNRALLLAGLSDF